MTPDKLDNPTVQQMPSEPPVPSPADIAPLFLRLARSGGDEPTGTRFDARDWIGTDPWS